ncbi:MAG: OsmC family protein [Pseudomonadota bacterium]
MDSSQLKSLQAPLKAQYRDDPDSAMIVLSAESKLGEGVTCKVDTGKAIVEAGLHPATGGDGLSACSGDMLLEALVACAGVTLGAVATALNIELRDATIRAEGELDFRGTLAVDKEAAVGFRKINMTFNLDCDASPEQRDSLIKLTERYCVVFQTLNSRPELVVNVTSNT